MYILYNNLQSNDDVRIKPFDHPFNHSKSLQNRFTYSQKALWSIDSLFSIYLLHKKVSRFEISIQGLSAFLKILFVTFAEIVSLKIHVYLSAQRSWQRMVLSYWIFWRPIIVIWKGPRISSVLTILKHWRSYCSVKSSNGN